MSEIVGLDELHLDPPFDGFLDHLQRFALELFATFERERPQRVHDLALLVHDVVVLQQSLPAARKF